MARRGDLNRWWRFGTALVGAVWRIFFRLRIAGGERVPARGPAIVAGNHVSALDGIVLVLATAERAWRMTRFLVAAESFRKRFVGWALRTYRQIPLRRGEGDTNAGSASSYCPVSPSGRCRPRACRGSTRASLRDGARPWGRPCS